MTEIFEMVLFLHNYKGMPSGVLFLLEGSERMAFIYVNGVEFPFPARGCNIIVTTPVDNARNAKAEVVGQRIGRDQYKINALVWPMLTAEQWKFILQAFSGFFATVTFPDPVTDDFISMKMYPGDRSADPYWVDERGKPTAFVNCKVNIIDCGV